MAEKEAAKADENSEIFKTRSEESFNVLKKIDPPLASALWKGTVMGTRKARAEFLAVIAEACVFSLKNWGEEPGHEHIEYMKNEAGWPWPTPATPEQLAKLIDLCRMTVKSPATAAAQR